MNQSIIKLALVWSFHFQLVQIYQQFCKQFKFQPGIGLSGSLAQWAPALTTQVHTSAPLCRVVSGKYRITKKRDRPLTYEMANPPHYIAHRKSWNSWNTCEYILTYSSKSRICVIKLTCRLWSFESSITSILLRLTWNSHWFFLSLPTELHEVCFSFSS